MTGADAPAVPAISASNTECSNGTRSRTLLPGVGPAVSGASWTPYDGHANPLNLLHALHKGFVENGGRYIPNTTVTEAAAAPGDFRIRSAVGEIAAPRVVVAAGSRQCRAGAAVRA